MIFVTSDNHFSHENIIEYCSRPFVSVEQMNITLVSAWNACIKEDDVCIHLGDVAFFKRANEHAMLSIKSLHGRKILIPGNHDKGFTVFEELGWHVVKTHYNRKKQTCAKLVVGDIALVHNPDFITHPEQFKIILHGHSHGTRGATRKIGNTFYADVGVDCWNYAPVSVSDFLDETQITCLKECITLLK